MTFPQDFLWGAATSSYQIEGAAREDGRGECIWTRFSHTPGNVLNNDNGDRACDHYHLYKDDVQLMQDLGLQTYRFSISWPRVLPTGTGDANEAGLDFYDRLVDELLAANIIPFATLYHWDLPQALQDKGGWTNPAIVQWFKDYAALVCQRLGDRVKFWATHNEPWVVAFLGNMIGEHAPGYTDMPTALQVAHHLLVSHGETVPVIREHVPDAKVGIVLAQSERSPASDDPRDAEAVRLSEVAGGNRWFLDPIFRGAYPADGVAVLRDHLDGIDLEAVSVAKAPLDFLGVNYYFRMIFGVNDEGQPHPPKIHPNPEAEHTEMGWEVYPDGLYNVLTSIHNDYGPIDMYITENGAAFDDPEPANGVVEDPHRQHYLETHFAAAERAIADGVPLKGYYVWSLLDNFEWAFGYERRFGIVHVDFETLQRTPKRSALFYRDWIASKTKQKTPLGE
jgi:beta-glucosidase